MLTIASALGSTTYLIGCVLTGIGVAGAAATTVYCVSQSEEVLSKLDKN